jgi:hypothetical protein
VHAGTRLDEFAPVWQFHEVHTLGISAPPERVFAAIRQVRADEIALFRTLTWIRRGGRPAPPGILNAGSTQPRAAYWRVIYPGSALIRRMWLRAIARRSASM